MQVRRVQEKSSLVSVGMVAGCVEFVVGGRCRGQDCVGDREWLHALYSVLGGRRMINGE